MEIEEVKVNPNSSKPYQSSLKINLPSNELAQILYETLNVDEELTPNKLTRDLKVEDHYLIV